MSLNADGEAVAVSIAAALNASGTAPWCAAVYRMYGPDGRLVPGVMSRVAPPPR